MSNNVSTAEPQIGPGHVFTVLGTQNEPQEIVAQGDRQAWNPAEDLCTGTLSVTRGPKEEPVEYWKDKVFRVDRFDSNRYVCVTTSGDVTTTITLLFERGRHVTEHSRVWMLFGTTAAVGGNVGEGDPGGGGWGGQNLR